MTDDAYDPNITYQTVAESATVLGIKTQSLRTAIQAGRIAVIRVHGRVLITQEALDDYRKRTQPDGKPRQGRPVKQKP